MPELPEVETVRRGLSGLIKGKQLETVEVLYTRMLDREASEFVAALKGQVVETIGRRGKYLLFFLTDTVLVSHLRMEGKYLFFEDDIPENRHFHVFFHFSDGTSLVYQDVRKFGTMELIEKKQLEAYFEQKKLGPEPIREDFDRAIFEKQLAKSKKPVKSHLLDQTLVAGLGNIYVDEVLYQAKILPQRLSNRLEKDEVTRLHTAIIAILQLGVEKGGSTIRSYRNALGMDGSMQEYLRVYGKAGQPCPLCQTRIVKTQLAGRGTHFCPTCQV